MTSHKVDVLAVMKGARECLREGPRGHGAIGDEMEKACAAIRELIDRAEYLCRTGEGMIAFRAALACVAAAPPDDCSP